jgi:hypothetical protein
MKNPVRIIVSLLVLCAVAAPLASSAQSSQKAIIAYVFAKDRILAPDEVLANSLTRVN